jgi:hypothetical protein
MTTIVGGRVMIKNNESKGNQDSEVIKIKVKPDIRKLINKSMGKTEINESEVIRQCIETGLFLGEMDSLINKQILEDISISERIQEVRRQNVEIIDIAQTRIKRTRNLFIEKEHEDINLAKQNKIEKDKDLWVRIDDETHNELKISADNMGVDISSFVKFCIRTGLYLGDLNVFLSSKKKKQ